MVTRLGGSPRVGLVRVWLIRKSPALGAVVRKLDLVAATRFVGADPRRERDWEGAG